MNDIARKLADRTAKVVVLGQGYVGLVVAMRASEAGFDVVGFEPNVERAKMLVSGSSYIEDISDEVLRRALDDGYVATADEADLAGFDVAVISVPTPLHDRQPDLSFIESASAMLAPHLRAGSLVILESTTYPGTTQEICGPILEGGSGLTAGTDFHLGYSPERIDPGNPAFGLHNTPKIVSGITEESLDLVDAFFSSFVEQTVRAKGCAEAELAKIIENTFRHVNIALVNEIAMYAYDLGVDANDAIDLAATKPFGFMRFTPGPGVGGHCLPIDPTYLSWRVKQHLGENFRFIELANDINDHMPHYVVRRVTALLNRHRKAVNGARILLLGAAYKPNVGDIRESPALTIIRLLHELGADLTVADPHVAALDLPGEVGHLDDVAVDDIAGSDLVVILTDHDAFDYDAISAHAPLVLDTRANLKDLADDRIEIL